MAAWLGGAMEGVLGWFAKHGEVRLSPPHRLREHTPIDDDPDGPDSFTDTTICGVAFALEYCDGRGWASLRTVRCLALDPQHPARLRAFCHVSQAERTFRFDRIISIAELRTGRILTSNEHMALLAPYLPDEYTDPDFPAFFKVRTAARDGVFALLHLAMPNGRLGTAARVAILNYVKAEAQALGYAMPPHAFLELWVDNLAPGLDAVLRAVDSLLADRKRFARVLPHLLKVMRSRETAYYREDAVRELIAEVREHFRHQPDDEWPYDLRATL